MNDAILAKLYTESKYKQLTKNICSRYGREYADDLHTEVILRIIEKGDDLNEVHDLFHYFFAYAHRTINEYKTSKKYGYNYNRIDSTYSYENVYSVSTYTYELLPSDKLYQLLEPDTKDTFRDDYKKKLFKIYLEEGNYRAVAKSTKIPLRNVAETLQEFKKELLKKINEHSFSNNG